MKKKQKNLAIIVVLAIAIFYLSPSFLSLIDTGCYQQSANVATACGGLATGSYIGTATNSYDGDWETYSLNGVVSEFTVTYMKPAGALSSSMWLIKDGTTDNFAPLMHPPDSSNPLLMALGVNIPIDCWDYYPDKLVFRGVDGGDSVSWYCDNGGWKTIRSESYAGQMIEEAIVWDIEETTPLVCTNTCLPTESQTPYPDCTCYTPTIPPVSSGESSVTGPISVNPGSVQTYHAILVEPYAGSYDSTLGVLTTRYCAVAFLDAGNNILAETGFTPCTTGYETDFTVNIPSASYANYVVVAAMTETKQHYTGTTWVIDYQDAVIEEAALALSSKVGTEPIEVAAPLSFASIIEAIAALINSILDAFKALFGF